LNEEEIKQLAASLSSNPEALARLVIELSQSTNPKLLKKYTSQLSQQTAEKITLESSESIAVPLGLFASRNHTILAVIVQYLREKHSLSLREISKHLHRNERSLWHTARSIGHKKLLPVNLDLPQIPINIFSSKQHTPLQILVLYCREHLGLRNKDIARILARDERTIASALTQSKRGGA